MIPGITMWPLVRDKRAEKLSSQMLCCGSHEAAKIKHLPVILIQTSVPSLSLPQERWRNTNFISSNTVVSAISPSSVFLQQ